MDIDSTSPSPSSYTLLRIKRKRTEEPLDALVVESESRIRRKKSRGGSAPSGISTPAGVFQFAQTIEHDAWEDVQRQLDLQVMKSFCFHLAFSSWLGVPFIENLHCFILLRLRCDKDQISRLAKKDPSPQSPPPLPTSSSHPTPLTTRSSPAQKAEGSKKRRYTIIPQQQQDLSSIPEYPRYPTSPYVPSHLYYSFSQLSNSPKVISHKDLAARNTTPFKLYDAVLSGESSSSKAQISDPEMDKFIPMLNDYLKRKPSPAPYLRTPRLILSQSTTFSLIHQHHPSHAIYPNPQPTPGPIHVPLQQTTYGIYSTTVPYLSVNGTKQPKSLPCTNSSLSLPIH